MLLDDFKKGLGENYHIQKMTEDTLKDAFGIMQANTYYFSKTQLHPVSIEECKQNLYTLPPDTALSQKYYIGIYEQSKCIALLDYIEHYPHKNIVYLGLFMLDSCYHRLGLGQKFVETFIECASKNGFLEIKLCCYEANKIGYHFWTHMGFVTEKESERDSDGITFKLLEMHKTRRE